MDDRPNILLICTDQQRYDALGAAGNPHVETPNLDRLAGQGVMFEHCYVQAPVCGPSRASLMTSRYLHNHGLWANGVDLDPTERVFTRTLADAGYDCGLVGKLHLGAAQHGRVEPRVDDGFSTFRWAHDPYVESPENHYHRWLREQHPGLLEDALATERPHDTIDRFAVEAHYSHWVGEETIEFLTNGRDPGRPFCFIANFFDPHHGFGAPQTFRDRYDPATLPPPVTSPDDLETKPAIYTEASISSYAGTLPGFRDHTPEQIQEIKAQYYAMVSLVDDEVGRILDTLDEQGLADDTVVVFTSDHGEMLGDHQLLLKGPMMFDCSVRVPLLVRWPGELPAGAVRDEIVEWIDLAPTFLQVAGAPPLPRAQGTSLLGLARDGRADGRRTWALSEYRNSGSEYDPAVHTTMVRTKDWKVVVHHGSPATSRGRDGELYDVVADPDELRNLWHDPSAADTRREMEAMLVDVLVATEDRSSPRISSF